MKKYSMKPIMILLSSNFLGLAVGGLFFLTASWNFDLADMGVYALAISIQLIFVGFVGTGLSVATIRLATDYLTGDNRPAAAGVIALAYLISILFSFLVAGVCLILTQITEEQHFLPGRIIMWVVFWAGTRSMLDCLRSGLLAQQQYKRAGMLMVMSAVTGLFSLLIAIFIGQLTVERLLVAHLVGLGTSAICGISLLLPLWRTGIHVSKIILRELVNYACWPSLSEGVRLAQTNLGPFILVAVAGSAQAGLFGIGRYPAYLFGVVAISLYQYWLPEVAREKGAAQMTRFLGRQMRLAGLAGAGMLIGAVAVRPLLPLLGTNFAEAAPLFLLNTLDFIVFLLVRPVETVYHGLYKPHLELILRFARLPLLVLLALWLASRYGAVGMVWAHLLSGVAVMGLAIWLLCRHLGSFPFIWNIWAEKSK